MAHQHTVEDQRVFPSAGDTADPLSNNITLFSLVGRAGLGPLASE